MFRRDAKKLSRVELKYYTMGQEQVLKSYKNMVRQKAWFYWKKLPSTVKVWISPEDVIEDGLQWAVTIGYEKWDESRGGNFGTFLWHGLEHYLDDKYRSYFNAEMRSDLLREKIGKRRYRVIGNRLSFIDAAMRENQQYDEGENIDFESVFKIKPKGVDFLTACYAADYLIKLYQECSDELKLALVRWFIRPPGDRRLTSRRYFKQLAGDRFVENSREFRELAQSYRLDIFDCRHIMSSPECLDKVSRTLLWMPYNINEPVASRVYQPALPIFRRDIGS